MTMPTLDRINSRETYIAYRVAWKETYKTLSAEIRSLKLKVKNDSRRGEYTGNDHRRRITLSRSASLMLADLEQAKAIARAHREETSQAA